MDALAEMVNIGMGRAAGMLNDMVGSHVTLRVPIVNLLSSADLERKKNELLPDVLSAVQLGFKEPFAGTAWLVFPTASAGKLVALLTEEGTRSSDLDEIRVGTLTEVGNILLSCVMGAIGNEIRTRINYSVPSYVEDTIGGLLASCVRSPGGAVIWVEVRFSVEQHQLSGDIILIFDVGSLDILLDAISI
jgi:chemotaxis protein CheC